MGGGGWAGSWGGGEDSAVVVWVFVLSLTLLFAVADAHPPRTGLFLCLSEVLVQFIEDSQACRDIATRCA